MKVVKELVGKGKFVGIAEDVLMEEIVVMVELVVVRREVTLAKFFCPFIYIFLFVL